MTTDRLDLLTWLLAAALCVVLPLALGHWDLALAGAGGLAVLAWRLRQQ